MLIEATGYINSFPGSPCPEWFTRSAVVFADAGRPVGSGPFSIIDGILQGMLRYDSIFHCSSWVSPKYKRPALSMAAGKVLAAAEAIEKGKILKAALCVVFGVKV